MGLLNLTQLVEGLLGFDKLGIGKLRSIEWSRKYLWDVQFVDGQPPEPFKNFIPATDIDINVANLENFQEESPLYPIRYPLRSAGKSITMTVIDDIDNTMFTWFRDWINKDILNNGEFISGIDDNHKITDSFNVTRNVKPVRMLQVKRKDNQQNDISFDTYYVFPDGSLNFSGLSVSESHTYTFNFIIIGEAGNSEQQKTTTQSLNLVQNALGRFI